MEKNKTLRYSEMKLRDNRDELKRLSAEARKRNARVRKLIRENAYFESEIRGFEQMELFNNSEEL